MPQIASITIPDVAPTRGLTDDLISQANNILAFAQQRTVVADQFASALSGAVLTLVAPVIDPVFPDNAIAPAVVSSAPPSVTTPVWVAPGIPTAFTDILDTSDLEIEPFDATPPAISYGTPPAAFSLPAPDAPAVNLAFDDPTLSVSLPAPPSLLAISVSPFSGLNLPTFSADEPVLTAVAPSVVAYTPGSKYTSGLLSALQASLLQRITDGGTGLGRNAENAIWDRGREREAKSQADAIAKLDQMERLGYAAPPGVYLDARLKIITETDYAERGYSREVMIKSAELELDNVKHALTTATELEARLIDENNQVEQRIFESCRYATEAGIAIYNAQVQAYGQMVELYKTKVTIYEALIRAEISKVDAYKAEIEAEQVKAQVNTALVEQYKVQADVALSSVEIYKAQIAAIQAKADIERTKVMVFGEQIRGYTAQVNAYTASVEGFRAATEAEGVKQQVFRAQVDAFSARVNASATQINARVEAFKARITAKESEVETYKALVQGETARINGLVATIGAQADIYKAQVTGDVGYNDVLTKQWQATLEQSRGIADVAVSTAKANAELYVSTRGLAIEAAKGSAQVSAQLGAAAINAFNVSGSISSSESYSSGTNNSFGMSFGISSSQSVSENYNHFIQD